MTARIPGLLCAALALSVALSACATTRLPAGPTDVEVEAYLAQENITWWHSMFPDDPVPPVTAFKTVSAGEQEIAVSGCLAASGLLATEKPSKVLQPDYPAYERAVWICFQRFPLPVKEVVAQGFMSAGQLAYLYDYYVERLVPCLSLHGFSVGTVPDRRSFLERSVSYASWNPYEQATPAPRTPRDWTALTAECPPPVFARFLAAQGSSGPAS